MTEYIEVHSAHRDRALYPLASYFVVRIAQTGCNGKLNATDPVALSAPQLVFTPFLTLVGGTLNPPAIPLTNATSPLNVIISFPAGTASHIRDYYTGLMFDVATVPPQTARATTWTYLSTSGGIDYFQMIPDSPLTGTGAVTVANPTDFTDPNNLYIFIPNGSASDNFYLNQLVYNQTLNEWLPIIAYDGTTHIARLGPSGTWATTDTFVLRTEPPSQFGNSLTPISPTTVSVPLPVSAGDFIRILSTNQIVRITDYVAATGIATIYPAFDPPIAGPQLYEVLPFSRDNEGFLNFNNTSAAIREPVCYDMSLLNITLPSSLINTSRGSRIVFYPHIYVEFRAEQNWGQGSNTLISNNPNARRMIFRALAGDNQNELTNPFNRLGGDGMVQRIKLDPLANYRFGVYLSDGSLFQTITNEWYSPLPTNPLAQITALFSFTRVVT